MTHYATDAQKITLLLIGCLHTWLCRSGMRGKKLHELDLIHMLLDESWANIKWGSHDLWFWVASDVKPKLVLVVQ